jgi:hypothetical protein
MSAQSIAVKLLSRSVRLLACVLRLTHAKFMNNLNVLEALPAEALLSLPGRLPFFCTAATSVDAVRALLTKLHPINTGREMIRLGPAGDGGYLIPDDLAGVTACFSPGVGNVAGFEFDCAQRGMTVFMADGSVSEPPIRNSGFRFMPKHIGPFTEGHFLSLKDWVMSETDGAQGDLLLQMDIEGSEYEVLLFTPESVLERFRIIIIEFHYLDRLFSEPLFALYSRVFEKLLRTHSCVHIHPNNICPTLTIQGATFLQMAEFTFLRNDRIRKRSFATMFPHPLDSDNTTNPACPLPSAYYR